MGDTNEREAAAEFTYIGRAPTPARIDVREFSHAAVVRRAVLGWAGCWGAAVAAVFLPVLHFVLVPALLIAGPLVFATRLRQRLQVLSARGACPACGEAQSFRVDAAPRDVMPFRCGACRRAIELRPERSLLGDAPTVKANGHAR